MERLWTASKHWVQGHRKIDYPTYAIQGNSIFLNRLAGAKNVRQVGVREAALEGKRHIAAASAEEKRVLKLTQKGVAGFGSVKDLYFRKAVEARLNVE